MALACKKEVCGRANKKNVRDWAIVGVRRGRGKLKNNHER